MEAPCTLGLVLLALGAVGSVGTVNAAVAGQPPSGGGGWLWRIHRTAHIGGLPFALAAACCLAAAVILLTAAC